MDSSISLENNFINILTVQYPVHLLYASFITQHIEPWPSLEKEKELILPALFGEIFAEVFQSIPLLAFLLYLE